MHSEKYQETNLYHSKLKHLMMNQSI